MTRAIIAAASLVALSAHAHAASQNDPIVLIQRQEEAERACVLDPSGKYPLRFGEEPVCDAARRFQGELIAARYCQFGGSSGYSWHMRRANKFGNCE
jgi:hypothetical protein